MVVAATAAPLVAAGGPPSDALSPALRHAVSLRMRSHERNLDDLLKAVLILDYRIAEDRARAITKSRLIDRPAPGETKTLNASAPARFLELQDQMEGQAKELANAAHRRDDATMGRVFGRMMETCIDCHSLYLWQDHPENISEPH